MNVLNQYGEETVAASVRMMFHRYGMDMLTAPMQLKLINMLSIERRLLDLLVQRRREVDALRKARGREDAA